jgi:hypothetical protein
MRSRTFHSTLNWIVCISASSVRVVCVRVVCKRVVCEPVSLKRVCECVVSRSMCLVCFETPEELTFKFSQIPRIRIRKFSIYRKFETRFETHSRTNKHIERLTTHSHTHALGLQARRLLAYRLLAYRLKGWIQLPLF